jgi:hypothetical protein
VALVNCIEEKSKYKNLLLKGSDVSLITTTLNHQAALASPMGTGSTRISMTFSPEDIK